MLSSMIIRAEVFMEAAQRLVSRTSKTLASLTCGGQRRSKVKFDQDQTSVDFVAQRCSGTLIVCCDLRRKWRERKSQLTLTARPFAALTRGLPQQGKCVNCSAKKNARDWPFSRRLPDSTKARKSTVKVSALMLYSTSSPGS